MDLKKEKNVNAEMELLFLSSLMDENIINAYEHPEEESDPFSVDLSKQFSTSMINLVMEERSIDFQTLKTQIENLGDKPLDFSKYVTKEYDPVAALEGLLREMEENRKAEAETDEENRF